MTEFDFLLWFVAFAWVVILVAIWLVLEVRGCCAVFPGGKGTVDMREKARKAALHVFVYTEPTEG